MNREILRVAVVLGEMGSGGIEQVVMNYYRHIDHSRVQLDFYVHEDSKKILKEEIESLGGTVTLIPKYSHVLTYIRVLIKEFREKQFRIVHIHLNAMSLFAQYAAWRAGVPIRITHNHSTSGKGETKRNMMKYILRLFSDCFVTDRCACSEYAAEWMWGKKKFKNGEVTIWPNAIDTEKFVYNEKFRSEIRKKYGIEDQYVIGHIGRFMKQKNHEFLIDIFYELQKQRKDVVLMLVGEGELKPDIQRKVKQLGIEEKVLFVGTTNEPWAYYSAFDVFVLPSLYEGLPVVGVEAQTSGLQCFFSNNITREADIVGVCYLPIQEGVSCWVEALQNFVGNFDRMRRADIVRIAGFDICESGKRLTEWYLSR